MSGREEPRAPSDVQCKHCGLFYDNRGIHGHQPHCTEGKTGGESMGKSGVSEGASGGSANQGTGKGESPIICPSCGNRKNGNEPAVAGAATTVGRLREADALTADMKATLEKYDYVCYRCEEVFL